VFIVGAFQMNLGTSLELRNKTKIIECCEMSHFNIWQQLAVVARIFVTLSIKKFAILVTDSGIFVVSTGFSELLIFAIKTNCLDCDA